MTPTTTRTLSLILASVLGSALALGCGTQQPGDDRPMGDAATGAPDAEQDVRIPTWALEDIQPESPMFGQTYGLEAFSGSVVVMVLVEGF